MIQLDELATTNSVVVSITRSLVVVRVRLVGSDNAIAPSFRRCERSFGYDGSLIWQAGRNLAWRRSRRGIVRATYTGISAVGLGHDYRSRLEHDVRDRVDFPYRRDVVS